MDLGKFNFSTAQSATLNLENPVAGEPFTEADGGPVTFQLISADSDDYKKLRQKVQNKRIRDTMKGRKAKMSIEEIEEDALDLLAACTKGWSNVTENGKEIEYSQANARELYSKYSWIREQVEAFVSDRANFLGNS